MKNRYYNLNFYKKCIEVELNYLPKDDFNKNKLFYDLILLLAIKIKFLIIKKN